MTLTRLSVIRRFRSSPWLTELEYGVQRLGVHVPCAGGTTFWRFAPTCQPLCVRCHPNPKTMPRPVVVPDIGRELLRKRYEQSVQKAKERRTKGEAPAASKTSLHSS